MSNPKRIWTTFERNGTYAGEYRELYKLSSNQYGDYLFHLDGGEVWQFTPHSKLSTPSIRQVPPRPAIEMLPKVEQVKSLGIGNNNKTGKPGFICFLLLDDNRSCTGNLRRFPRADLVGAGPANRDEVKAIKKVIKAEHEATRKAMPKAARHGFKLAMNDRDKGRKSPGAQPKEINQRLRDAVRKVKALAPGMTQAEACRRVHQDDKLKISLGRFQNICSSPREQKRIGYKKTNPHKEPSHKK